MAREVELNKVAGGGGDLEAMAAASSEVRGRLGHFFQEKRAKSHFAQDVKNGRGGWLAKYAQLAERRPRQLLAASLGVCFALTVVAMALGAFNMAEETNYDWIVKSDPAVQKNFMISLASEDQSEGLEMPERSFRNPDQTLFVAFRAKAGEATVFTEANVKEMYALEEIVLKHKDWAKYCLLDHGGAEPACAPPASLREMLGGAETQAAIDARLAAIAADPALLFRWGFNLDKDFGKGGSINARVAQSGFSLGLPLEGYKSPKEDLANQQKSGDAFLVVLGKEMQRRYGMKAPWMMRSSYEDSAESGEGMEVSFWGLPVQIDEWKTIQYKDISWVFFCLISVGSYLFYHTGSGLFAGVGMTEIFLSLGVAGFLYKGVFQVTYFAFMHILIIFVILGIGADDVFVYLDAFHQSREELQTCIAEPSLSQRLQYTSLRASKAIFTTSFTTSVAFFATGVSPILPIRAFGIFSGIVILSLYCSNVFVMPPTIIVYEKFLRGTTLLTCFRGKKEDVPGATVIDEPTIDGGMRATEKFFYGPFANALAGPLKYIVCVAFLGLMAGGVFLCTKLAPPTDTEQWFPTHHMFRKYVGDVGKDFSTQSQNANSLQVVIAYGMKELDLSGTGVWRPGEIGKVVYDDAFTLKSGKAQRHIADTCRELRGRKCAEKACTGGHLVMGDLNCFIEDFYSWEWLPTAADAASCGAAPCASHTLENPLEGDEFLAQLFRFTQSKVGRITYPGHIGFDPKDAATLQFVQLFVPSSIVPPVAPKDFKPAQEAWDAFVAERNRAAAGQSIPELGNGFAAGESIFWLWSRTTEALVKSLYTGMAICFPFAFLVIAISTANVWLAFLATFTIFGIVTTVLGLGAKGMLGWHLGTAETIAAVIIIGFSVDYYVHLANAYMESEGGSRVEKMRDSLGTMGISVMAGAVTTFLSGVWLWGCVITFFNKFAFLVVGTVVSSYLWSVLFFASACMVVGPTGNFGSIKFLTQLPGKLLGRGRAAAAAADGG